MMRWCRGGIILLLLTAGCSLEPSAAPHERADVGRAGRPYGKPFAQRQLPVLSDAPSWQDVLQRAFLANGDLEAAYFEWKAAVDVIRGTGEWPNSQIGLGIDHFWSRDGLKSFDHTTLSVQSDPSMNVAFPLKTAQAAKIAYDSARSAGHRFAAAKFALQQKVLWAYYDCALAQEKLRIQQEAVRLLQVIAESAGQRVQTGSPQEDLLRAQTEYELGANELENLKVELAIQRANLNAILSRPPDARLEIPALPQPRSWNGRDDSLIAQAVEGNPELAALAAEVTSRNDSVHLAKLAWIPDFNIGFAWQGNVQQTLTSMIMLPTTILRIQGQIDAANAFLCQAQATSRQAYSQKQSDFLSALYAFRNSQRQVELFRTRIVPRAQQTWENSTRLYSSGQSGVIDFIQGQRTLLQVRQSIAEAAMTREKKLAEMEALVGVDLEALAATQPATMQPASAPAGK